MLIKSSKLKNFLTISEACHLLNVHPNTLRNWDNSGKLKAIRIGDRKDRRYKKEDVLSFFHGEKKSEDNQFKVASTQLKEFSFNFQDVQPLGSVLPTLKTSQK
ncbi:MAG: hypothetical protein COS97_02755 [Candidatus Nealsonbacteria bacterium CG07_land_8_20_14_0_80_40_10]|nr:MAG: hypothetical protein COS97_02755 [Candidatus Nealsonbacteria bacterium CG07_land_8_20_14_0_80_40_10]